MALEWVTGKLYVGIEAASVHNAGRIEVCSLEMNTSCAIVLHSSFNNPGSRVDALHSIVLDPLDGYMYWLNRVHKRIERAWMDGRHHDAYPFRDDTKDVVTTAALTLEQASRTLYYARTKISPDDSQIWSCHLYDRESCRIVATKVNAFYLDVLDSLLVWTSVTNQNSGITLCEKDDCAGTMRQIADSNGVEALRVLDLRSQPQSIDRVLLVATTSGLISISLETKDYTPLPLPYANTDTQEWKIMHVDYDPIDKKVYVIDGESGVIRRCKFDGSEQEEIIKDGVTPKSEALAVDWLNRNIYWLDSNIAQIKIQSLIGGYRQTVISHGLGQPRGLAIDPVGGYIYFSDWHESMGRIERAWLDGTHRVILIVLEEDAWPNGIAIDPEQDRIFWAEGRRSLIKSAVLRDGPNGSRGCMCPVGYELRADNATCVMPTAFIVYTASTSSRGIMRISLEKSPTNNHRINIANMTSTPASFDIDQSRQRLFWVAEGRGRFTRANLRSAFFNGSDVRTVLESVSINHLSIDWITGNIYWCNIEQRRIEIAAKDGHARRTIAWEELNPRHLAVHPTELFFVFVNYFNPNRIAIHKAPLEGHRTGGPILIRDVHLVSALAIDFESELIVWSETADLIGTISVVDFNGANRAQLISNERFLPVALAVYQKKVYFANARTNNIETYEGDALNVLHINISNVLKLGIAHGQSAKAPRKFLLIATRGRFIRFNLKRTPTTSVSWKDTHSISISRHSGCAILFALAVDELGRQLFVSCAEHGLSHASSIHVWRIKENDNLDYIGVVVSGRERSSVTDRPPYPRQIAVFPRLNLLFYVDVGGQMPVIVRCLLDGRQCVLWETPNLMPFVRMHANQANDRLYYTTANGLWSRDAHVFSDVRCHVKTTQMDAIDMAPISDTTMIVVAKNESQYEDLLLEAQDDVPTVSLEELKRDELTTPISIRRILTLTVKLKIEIAVVIYASNMCLARIGNSNVMMASSVFTMRRNVMGITIAQMVAMSHRGGVVMWQSRVGLAMMAKHLSDVISFVMVCVTECGDGSDEAHCRCAHPAEQFDCSQWGEMVFGENECVSRVVLCDGITTTQNASFAPLPLNTSAEARVLLPAHPDGTQVEDTGHKRNQKYGR
uniref:Low-density lipoprotein receptor repeat class B n=1 Tax=Parascaris univalens TaxID=6257 RepID=A0A915A586_PARUN